MSKFNQITCWVWKFSPAYWVYRREKRVVFFSNKLRLTVIVYLQCFDCWIVQVVRIVYQFDFQLLVGILQKTSSVYFDLCPRSSPKIVNKQQNLWNFPRTDVSVFTDSFLYRFVDNIFKTNTIFRHLFFIWIWLEFESLDFDIA